MRLIKSSLAGPVLAAILAMMPAAAFANGGGGGRSGGEAIYFVSGHDHQYLYISGHSWKLGFEETALFVPGQLLNAGHPNYIVLDTDSGDAEWHTLSQIWISENELFDHLVLKFPKE
jgi:hypothetical protein